MCHLLVVVKTVSAIRTHDISEITHICPVEIPILWTESKLLILLSLVYYFSLLTFITGDPAALFEIG